MPAMPRDCTGHNGFLEWLGFLPETPVNSVSYRHYFWHGAEFGDADHSGVVPERNFDEGGGLNACPRERYGGLEVNLPDGLATANDVLYKADYHGDPNDSVEGPTFIMSKNFFHKTETVNMKPPAPEGFPGGGSTTQQLVQFAPENPPPKTEEDYAAVLQNMYAANDKSSQFAGANGMPFGMGGSVNPLNPTAGMMGMGAMGATGAMPGVPVTYPGTTPALPAQPAMGSGMMAGQPLAVGQPSTGQGMGLSVSVQPQRL